MCRGRGTDHRQADRHAGRGSIGQWKICVDCNQQVGLRQVETVAVRARGGT